MVLTTIFAIALILLGTTKSSAILQANAATHKSPATKNGATWLTEIRQMETANQTMGLSETLNGLNATKENGIDVHMMLPTEYGAVAILSASGYGNPKKLKDETNAQKRTTTGNSTGVYFTGDRWEITASHDTSKYMNKNENAIGTIVKFAGTNGWHGGSYTSDIQIGSIKYSTANTLIRGTSNRFPYGEPGFMVSSGLGIFSAGWHGSSYASTDFWGTTGGLNSRGTATII